MEIGQKVRGMRRGTRRIVIVGVVVAIGLGIYWFEPQSLFQNSVADQALPGTAAGGGSTGEVTTLSEGSFVSLAHGTTGTAKIVEADGTSYLRFENLDSFPGPDLVVYLTSQAASGDASTFGETVVADLGLLEANKGNLNIEIPAGTDLSEVRSAVIWCRRFTVAFGAADLAPVPPS